MADKAWKKRERAGARAFDAERTVGSGSLGREDRTRSDSTHDRLFIETKLREKHAVVSLWDKVSAHAKKEAKVPLVLLAQKGRHGLWAMCKLDDLPFIASEYEAAQKKKREKDLPGQTRFA